jgi:hypothetical protein
MRVQTEEAVMSKLQPAFAALLLLSACGGRDQPGVGNETAEAGANALGTANAAEPVQPGQPVNAVVDPVPPPEAVSHPDGYLPPAPGEDPAPANSSGPERSPPATEDDYMRNGQAGR